MTNAAPTVATPAAATPNPVTGISTTLSVLGDDDGGEANLTYAWTVSAEPAGAADPTFSSNGNNAAKDTTATFSEAGSYTFLVTITDAGGLSTTSSVDVTVVQTLTTITDSPSSATLNLNSTQSFSAVGYDQFGAALVVQPSFTWGIASGVGSIDDTGQFNAGTVAGTATITATSGAVSGGATITVTNAAPTVATPAAAMPNPITGTTTSLSVLGDDDGGEANLTYTWTVSAEPIGAADPTFSSNGNNAAKDTTATFSEAGSYTFLVTITDTGGLSTTSSVDVTVSQSLTTITDSPSAANLNLNGTQSFSAVGYDQFGAHLTVQPSFTWGIASGVGSIDGSGLYTAGSVAGTATITATSGAVSGGATITVTNAAPTVVTPAAATPNPITGTSTTLSVLGVDDGGEANLTYTWTVSAEPIGAADPAFSSNRNNAAKDTTATFSEAGSYTFLVTITDTGGLSTTSSVDVTVIQTLTSITDSPSSANLNLNGIQSFSAVGYDQFGTALVVQPSFTWSITSGVGSIDDTGQFNAGTVAGSATITATSGAVSGGATIIVTNAAPTVATPAAATPNPITGTTTSLSVLGVDDGGEANLTYTWTVSAEPIGAADPAFSSNRNNAAKDTTATFSEAGSYTFLVTITDTGGLSTTSSVDVTVIQTLTSITDSPSSANLNLNGIQSFSAVGYDQFGAPLGGPAQIHLGHRFRRRFDRRRRDCTPLAPLPGRP